MNQFLLSNISLEELDNVIQNSVRKVLNHLDLKSQPEKPDHCSLSDACQITGLSKSTVYKLSMQGEIPRARFGKRLVFSRKELIAWMEAKTITATDPKAVMNERLAKAAKKGRR